MDKNQKQWICFACVVIVLWVTTSHTQPDPEFSMQSRSDIVALPRPQVSNPISKQAASAGAVRVLVMVEHLENDWWTCFQRVGHIVQGLRDMGHAVVVATLRGQPTQHWKSFYRMLQTPIIPLDSWKGDNPQTGHFDIVMYSTFWWEFNSIYERSISTIRQLLPKARHVVIADDVGWFSKYGTLKEGELLQKAVQKCVQRPRQVSVYEDCDAVITITDADSQRIIQDLEELGENQVSTSQLQKTIQPVRYVSDSVSSPSSVPPFSERGNAILFVGNGYNPTNVVGVEWLVHEVLPLAQDVKPRLYIIGKGWSPEMVDSNNVVFLGEKQDLSLYLRSAKVCVTPSIAGTGLNTKSITYLASGTPLVATTKGVTGLGLEGNDVAIVADTPASFADAIRRLMRDQVLWHTMSQAGLEHIRTQFSHQQLRNDLARVLAHVLPKKGPQKRIAQAKHTHFDVNDPVVLPDSCDTPPNSLHKGQALFFSNSMFDGVSWGITDPNQVSHVDLTLGSILLGPDTHVKVSDGTNEEIFTSSVVDTGRWGLLARSVEVVHV